MNRSDCPDSYSASVCTPSRIVLRALPISEASSKSFDSRADVSPPEGELSSPKRSMIGAAGLGSSADSS